MLEIHRSPRTPFDVGDESENIAEGQRYSRFGTMAPRFNRPRYNSFEEFDPKQFIAVKEK